MTTIFQKRKNYYKVYFDSFLFGQNCFHKGNTCNLAKHIFRVYFDSFFVARIVFKMETGLCSLYSHCECHLVLEHTHTNTHTHTHTHTHTSVQLLVTAVYNDVSVSNVNLTILNLFSYTQQLCIPLQWVAVVYFPGDFLYQMHGLTEALCQALGLNTCASPHIFCHANKIDGNESSIRSSVGTCFQLFSHNPLWQLACCSEGELLDPPFEVTCTRRSQSESLFSRNPWRQVTDNWI